jgi:anthranilate/para-aminobenzoate synthase component I
VTLSEPPHVESLQTVHHRFATVRGGLRSGVGRQELLEAMLPSGSVTGAPKLRAMEIIRELEPARRGLYTGALGFVRADGGLELGMAIRTLTVKGGEGAYFSGGGIVADSDPEREVEETLWKARRLIELDGGRHENWA